MPWLQCFCPGSEVLWGQRSSCSISQTLHFLGEIGELSQTTLAQRDQTRYWASEKQILLVVVNGRQTESGRPCWVRHSHNAIRISPLHHAAHLMFPKRSLILIYILTVSPAVWEEPHDASDIRLHMLFMEITIFPFQVPISADSFINTRSHWEQLSQCLLTADIIQSKSTAYVQYWLFLCAEQPISFQALMRS